MKASVASRACSCGLASASMSGMGAKCSRFCWREYGAAAGAGARRRLGIMTYVDAVKRFMGAAQEAG
jgi:hypothetical protein